MNIYFNFLTIYFTENHAHSMKKPSKIKSKVSNFTTTVSMFKREHLFLIQGNSNASNSYIHIDRLSEALSSWSLRGHQVKSNALSSLSPSERGYRKQYFLLNRKGNDDFNYQGCSKLKNWNWMSLYSHYIVIKSLSSVLCAYVSLLIEISWTEFLRFQTNLV